MPFGPEHNFKAFIFSKIVEFSLGTVKYTDYLCRVLGKFVWKKSSPPFFISSKTYIRLWKPMLCIYCMHQTPINSHESLDLTWHTFWLQAEKNIALFPAHRPGEIFFACYPAANKKIFFISLCNIWNVITLVTMVTYDRISSFGVIISTV